MTPCHAAGEVLRSSDTIEQKRERFEVAVSQIRAAFGFIPADDPDVMVPPRSAFTPYRRLHAICATTSARLHLFDPYLGAQAFLLYLADVPAGVEIKVVTDETIMVPDPKKEKKRINQRDRIVATSELLANERAADYSFLMVPSIHDRHLRADDTIFHLGNSVVHASLKDVYTITEMKKDSALHATLDGYITAATPWYQPGMSRHRRWCPTCARASDVTTSGACQGCKTPL